ncbi:hypothetical protein M422DRAFT_158179 [Sphaerobolus stellatus SS14]|nr:hypothetical protein M422DRAFT_158179 [Sphaerobolus stellatus SS14]
MAPTASLVAQHILSRLATHAPRTKPLFAAVQGPQGSGKTHLTRSLVSILSSPPHSLQVAVLSIDDLYLTHDGLVELAAHNPNNKLWQGRGQPGTHDVKLGADILAQLCDLNNTQSQVLLPSFDKSKFNGEGDRVAEAVPVDPPIDVVIFEGWCVGFYPLTEAELEAKWESICMQVRSDPGSILARSMAPLCKEDIKAVNDALRGYVKAWYNFFDAFVQICSPLDTGYEYIYLWRLQQEHNMKAKNGGIGMTDEQVTRFVDRYIPGYDFFGQGVITGGTAEGLPPWMGNGLRITIDKNRNVIDTSEF